jgi:hypothetical protein
MNENLSEMVKTESDEPMVFSESDLDLPSEETSETPEPEEAAAPAEPEVESIPIAVLGPWFEANATNFSNINLVKVSIRGINPTSNLIIAVKDGSGETDETGEAKRQLRVFDNADTQPVLALKGIDMQVYNNGFRVICEYGDNIYMKCYGIRTGLIAVFCNNINGVLVPYHVSRVKRTDEAVEVVRKNAAEVELKLNEAANLEDLQLRYKQSSKAVTDLHTNLEVVKWLLDRQNEIYDINHHLQIDNVIIETLE